LRREHDLRHLPVLDGGRIVGVVSQRDRKVGSAIVCEGDRVLGAFTTIDALRALHHLLERR
jgi:CBS domain-containing protein